ncbi:MAG TPA: hypothetical protein VF510_15900 [Ktedonobacterales bacterium]
MWVLRYLFFSVVLSVFGLTLILFLFQNVHTEQLEFFGLEYTTNMVWVLVGAAAFGALVVLILLVPGRLAATLHNWSVEREIQHIERDLGQLQEQREYLLNRHEDLLEAHERLLQGYHRLVAEHSRMIAERDRARSQLAARDAAGATQTHVAPAASPARLALPAPETTREQSTLPGLAIMSPVAAAMGSQSSGARGGRGHSGQGIAPASGAVAGSAVGRERDLPAEAVRAANRPARAETAEHRSAMEEQASLPRAAGHAGAVLASAWPSASAAAAALRPTAAPPAPTGPIDPMDPTPALPTPPTPSNPVPTAPAAATRSASLQRAAISSSIIAPSARLLAALRARLRENSAKSAALLAAQRVALQRTFMAKLAQLKQLRLPSSLPIGPTGDTPVDPPDSNDPA